MELVWAYIQSATEEELKYRRTVMKVAMRPLDREYINRH
jgi:hypothetical protein